MPMPRDDHEVLLNELLIPDLEQSRRTEILQQLRVDYGTVHVDFDGLTVANTKFQKDNSDLIVSNSQLFRQVGITGNPKKEEEQNQKTFSETVTLENIEKQTH